MIEVTQQVKTEVFFKKIPSIICCSAEVIGGFPDSSAGKEFTCNTGDCDLISGMERLAGEGTGYPLQYS